MAGDNSSLHDRRLLYVAPLVIAILIIGIGALVILYRPQDGPVVVSPEPEKTGISKTSLPSKILKPVPLTRTDLINGARNAADGFTASGALPRGPDSLIGRRFSIRIPFGCGGVQGGYTPAQMSMVYNAENQSITLSATPGVWTTVPIMQEVTSEASLETVEGFWVPRPWTYSDSCPTQTNYPIPATPTPATGQTLGLAQLFEAGGSRVSHHADHPYAFTRKIKAGDTGILNHSYQLLLEGKIEGYRDGHSLRCWMEAPDHQPLCIYAVAFEHVAFVDADTGETLANWND
jgi:hypothetical protein